MVCVPNLYGQKRCLGHPLCRIFRTPFNSNDIAAANDLFAAASSNCNHFSSDPASLSKPEPLLFIAGDPIRSMIPSELYRSLPARRMSAYCGVPSP